MSNRTGYKLFHNHLVIDLLLSTFDFGTPPFVELREEIWLSVFDHACRTSLPGLLFTFNPETTVRPGFMERAIRVVTGHGGTIDFIELVCPLAELKNRIESASRRQHRKLSSLAFFEALHASGEFDTSHMPQPRLTLDTSRIAPAEAAALISDTLKLAGSAPR